MPSLASLGDCCHDQYAETGSLFLTVSATFLLFHLLSIFVFLCIYHNGTNSDRLGILETIYGDTGTRGQGLYCTVHTPTFFYFFFSFVYKEIPIKYMIQPFVIY